jgi:hypothetical protein
LNPAKRDASCSEKEKYSRTTGKTAIHLRNSKRNQQRMKFENKKQRVIPVSRFLMRLARYGLFALLLIIVSVLLGTVGYHSLGRLGWIDSFQMACMILTGMGPVSAMPDDKAKIFSSLYALYSGIAFLSITAVFFAPVIHRLLHILHVEESGDAVK